MMMGRDTGQPAVAGGPAPHIPVLGPQAIELLAMRDGGVYVDAEGTGSTIYMPALTTYNGNATLYGQGRMLSVVTLASGVGTGQATLNIAGSTTLTAVATGISGTSKAFTVRRRPAPTPCVTVHPVPANCAPRR